MHVFRAEHDLRLPSNLIHMAKGHRGDGWTATGDDDPAHRRGPSSTRGWCRRWRRSNGACMRIRLAPGHGAGGNGWRRSWARPVYTSAWTHRSTHRSGQRRGRKRNARNSTMLILPASACFFRGQDAIERGRRRRWNTDDIAQPRHNARRRGMPHSRSHERFAGHSSSGRRRSHEKGVMRIGCGRRGRSSRTIRPPRSVQTNNDRGGW